MPGLIVNNSGFNGSLQAQKRQPRFHTVRLSATVERPGLQNGTIDRLLINAWIFDCGTIVVIYRDFDLPLRQYRVKINGGFVLATTRWLLLTVIATAFYNFLVKIQHEGDERSQYQ